MILSQGVFLIIVFSCAAIILFFLLFAVLVYDHSQRGVSLQKTEEQDWLFKGFHEAVFDLFYKNGKSEKLCGIDLIEYDRKCRILHLKPQVKKHIAYRIEGALLFLFFLALAWLLSRNLILCGICGAAAFVFFYFLWVMPEKKLDKMVEDKLFYVKDDLPRFLSLLEKAMDLPIDQAMLLTARRFASPLCEDIIDSINKVSLGANGWQETLVDLAKTYEIEDFSDLVLEIVNSYEQGVNIRPLVNRKAKEVEMNRLYAMEAHDTSIKTMIYLPVIGLKVLPLMALVCMPMLGNFL